MVSVIVPVFHSHKTLKKCIKSILCQNYSDLQLIVVIDGTDEYQEMSLDICRLFASKDARLKLIIQDNKGVDRARFAGLNAADGDYITFIDADDWLEPEAIESMYNIIIQDDYDYVQISHTKCLGPIRRLSHLPTSGCINNPELFEKYYMSFFGWKILPVTIWGKLFRRESLERAELTPSGFSMGEDLLFNMNLFPFLRKIYLIDQPYYNYRYGGMTSKYNPHLLSDLKSQFLLKLQAIEKYSYHQADNPVRIEMINVLHSDIKQRIIYKKNQTDQGIIDAIKEELTDVVWLDVLNITTNYMDNSPFYLAFKNYDVETMFDICKKDIASTRIQRIGKKTISRIIKLF